MSDDSTPPFPVENPFSPVGVAQVSQTPGELVTVETDAIRTACLRFTSYVDAVRSSTRPESAAVGNVLAVTGDYGSGKTHLAMMLLNQAYGENLTRIADGRSADISCVYLEAAATFRGVYLDFVDRLSPDEVNARVREYYAGIVTRRLGDTELSARAGALLRSGTIDPVEITLTLGLSEAGLLDEVRATLAAVTSNSAFATALTLLLRPGFAEHVWPWLRGGEPPQVLVERGVIAAIGDDATALEAFGVFALLYGHQQRPFVLILDEMTRLLPVARRDRDRSAAMFRAFLDVFNGTGALLVLAGLTESFDLLADAARQRIGDFVTLTAFDVTQTRELVTRQLAAVPHDDAGHGPLWPFTDDAVDELARLTGGNTRKIVQYCHRLYSATMINNASRPPVTGEQVRHLVREAVGRPLREHVRYLAGEAVESLGWPYDPDYFTSVDATSHVDLWIPVGAESGCAVFVTEVVADEEDIQLLEARAATVRESSVRSEMLLVVSGPLSSAHVPRLRAAFTREPLAYREQSFTDDMVTALKVMRHRLELVSDGETDGVLRDRVIRLADQQTSMQNSLEQLAAGVREIQASSEQAFGVVRRDLAEAVRLAASFADRQGGPADVPMTALPKRVRQLFDERIALLATLMTHGSAAEPMDSLFTLNLDRQDRRERLVTLMNSLRPNQSVLPGLGAALLLRAVAEAFRRGVNEWFRTSAPGEGRRLHTRDREEFESLCQTYDSALEHLSMQSLEGLAESGDARQRRRRTEQVYGVSRQFESLGVDVRHAVLSAFPA